MSVNGQYDIIIIGSGAGGGTLAPGAVIAGRYQHGWMLEFGAKLAGDRR